MKNMNLSFSEIEWTHALGSLVSSWGTVSGSESASLSKKNKPGIKKICVLQGISELSKCD